MKYILKQISNLSNTYPDNLSAKKLYLIKTHLLSQLCLLLGRTCIVITAAGTRTTNPTWNYKTSQCHLTHLFTAESVRMVAMGDLMFFRSHTLTVRSSLPDTTLSPTVNTADVTVLQTNRDEKTTTIRDSCVTFVLSSGGTV